MRAAVPQIVTITCHCGASGDAPVGAYVECECGRSFNASAPQTHDAALGDLRRQQQVLLAASLLALVALCAAPLAMFDRGAMMLVPVAALALWFATVRPQLDRWHRRRLAELPGWSLQG